MTMKAMMITMVVMTAMMMIITHIPGLALLLSHGGASRLPTSSRAIVATIVLALGQHDHRGRKIGERKFQRKVSFNDKEDGLLTSSGHSLTHSWPPCWHSPVFVVLRSTVQPAMSTSLLTAMQQVNVLSLSLYFFTLTITITVQCSTLDI